MTGRWIVKRHRYDGSTSIVAFHDVREEADRDAQKRNEEEQCGQYRVEKWEAS